MLKLGSLWPNWILYIAIRSALRKHPRIFIKTFYSISSHLNVKNQRLVTG